MGSTDKPHIYKIVSCENQLIILEGKSTGEGRDYSEKKKKILIPFLLTLYILHVTDT